MQNVQLLFLLMQILLSLKQGIMSHVNASLFVLTISAAWFEIRLDPKC